VVSGSASLPRKLVVAVGGNAIHPGGIKGTVAEQRVLAAKAAASLLDLLCGVEQLIVTHGNGPVVGKILMRQALARGQVAPMTLDVCVAHSQGGIAYLLQQAFENELARSAPKVQRRVLSLLTQVEVEADDPAFASPSKPVGFFFDAEHAAELQQALAWTMREDSGRGYRHVVPSPNPKRILEGDLIDTLATAGTIVIAGGGGGIPVIQKADGSREGVEAVIDKDLCSALLAVQLQADVLLILTAVSRVALHFGQPDQRDLGQISVDELCAYRDQGHFAAGSMGPKVEAAIRFVQQTGRRAVIAHLHEATAALRGETGTQVTA
jgi:carbamate kinase